MKKFYLIVIILYLPHFIQAQFTQDGTNLYHLGKVGIGIENPFYNLHVYEPVGYGTTMLLDAAPNANPNLLFRINGQNAANIKVDDQDNNQLQFQIINDNGNAWITALSIERSGKVKFSSSNGGIHITDYGSSNYLQVGGRDILTGKGFVFKSNTNNTASKQFSLYVSDGNIQQERLTILKNGSVGIGTTNPDSKLTVAGNVLAREVKVTATAGGADFVFEEDYDLPSLKEVEKFIITNKHLPGIPSAETMEAEGLNLAEMNIKLLQKIEELTLYMIEQKKEIEQLSKQNNTLNDKIYKNNQLIEDLAKKVEMFENN